MKYPLRAFCIRQGYVPPGCLMDGVLTLSLMLQGEDPCAGCGKKRKKCGGRPKTKTWPRKKKPKGPLRRSTLSKKHRNVMASTSRALDAHEEGEKASG